MPSLDSESAYRLAQILEIGIDESIDQGDKLNKSKFSIFADPYTVFIADSFRQEARLSSSAVLSLKHQTVCRNPRCTDAHMAMISEEDKWCE